jgi:hypothetical protein
MSEPTTPATPRVTISEKVIVLGEDKSKNLATVPEEHQEPPTPEINKKFES